MARVDAETVVGDGVGGVVMADIIPSKIVHPGELAQFPLNANSHPDTQVDELVASRQRFSQYRNVVVWTCPANTETEDAAGKPITLKRGIAYVIAGNGFHLASLKRHDESIEVKDYSHLSLDEAILLAETDNAAPLGAQKMIAQLQANLERTRGLYEDDERLRRMFDRLKNEIGIVDTISWEDAAGNLANGDRAPFQQMTFTLHDSQVVIVKDALRHAQPENESPNENSNGNALAHICKVFANGNG